MLQSLGSTTPCSACPCNRFSPQPATLNFNLDLDNVFYADAFKTVSVDIVSVSETVSVDSLGH